MASVRSPRCFAPVPLCTCALLLLSARAISASRLSAPRARTSVLRLHGGEADDDLLDDADDGDTKQEKGPLSEEAVMEKLNDVPAFVVMSGNDDDDMGFVAVPTADGSQVIYFFTEPDDAKAMLNETAAIKPDLTLRLNSVGLGDALQLCSGFVGGDDDASFSDRRAAFAATIAAFAEHNVSLVLQGNRALVEKLGPELERQLSALGIERGAWVFPVFICNEAIVNRGADAAPIFLNPREIRTLYPAAVDKEEPKVGVVDIRMVVSDMRTKGDVPWSSVRFVGPQGAAEFANELQEL